MPSQLIITLIIGIAIIAFAFRCAIGSRESNQASRILAAVILVPVALFCLFGFAAAMEPGDNHIFWRIGYGVVFLTCLFTIGRLVLARRPDNNASQD